MRFQLVEDAALHAVIKRHPGDQRCDHDDAGSVGRRNETHMRCRIHYLSLSLQPVALACSKRSVRTRRRKISLRMAASKSVTNRTVNAAAIAISGMRMAGWIVEPPRRNTDAPWCSVFHQSTENLMIGRSMAPTMVRIAIARAAREGSSTVRQSASTAR